MKTKVPFWKRSPLYRNKRRVNFLGAFKKWKRENGDEARRVNERFQCEQAS